jgi:hypothetical protein
MIVWINGTFGVGKTTVANELTKLLPHARLFDSEYAGYMLRHVLASEKVADFQDWPPWRSTVVATTTSILDYVGGTLVIPQTVLVERYWREIRAGLEAAGIRVCHLVLHATPEELQRSIETDTVETGAVQWRLDHLDPYEAARSWLVREAEIIDTTGLDPARVAASIAASVRVSSPGG